MSGGASNRTEAALQAQVLDAARLYGWRVHHGRPAMNQSGRWSTPIQGDRGFPDLVLVHPAGAVLVLELKGDTGRPGPGQREWIDGFRAAGIDASFAGPDDLPAIVAKLARRGG